MQIQKNSIFISNQEKGKFNFFSLGEKINATLINDLGNGFYNLNIKGEDIIVKSYIPLKKNEIFVVSEKTDKQIVLKQEVSLNNINIESLILSFPKLKLIDSPFIPLILAEFLKRNISIDEEKILKIYNLLKDFKQEQIDNGIIRFLVKLLEENILINKEMVNILLEYVNFFKEKKNEKKFKKDTFSDNKVNDILEKEEKDKLIEFLKNIQDFLKLDKEKGSFYFILPFITEDEKFYSEFKIIFEKNERGEIDYSFSASIHFSTGEIKIRGSLIQNNVYIKLFFENIEFMNFCKQEINNEGLSELNINFFLLDDLDKNYKIELFSDIYFYE